jgi:2-(1,2-epoxy-1,2-dihydrophenyl)acetyl-CoA isomerase
MADFEFIKFTTEGATAVITINRPKVYNALNGVAKEEIRSAISEANKNPGIRSIILTGEGKAFCTGQDLNDRNVKSEAGKAVDLGNTLLTEWIPLVNSISKSKKIVVTAINGVVAGAGLSVAMASDLIISGPKIKFISGFSKLGLAPDAGSSFVFSRALGLKKALEFFLFNEPLSSEEMKEKGLINEIDADPLKYALEFAEKINKMAPLSVEMIKSNLQYALETSSKESMENETYSQRLLGNTQDYQEGLKAFFEKRAPLFQGQ